LGGTKKKETKVEKKIANERPVQGHLLYGYYNLSSKTRRQRTVNAGGAAGKII